MRLLDVLKYAFSDYTSNKFKTAMSSLGIVIGVFAVVVMITLGNGLQAGVSQQFKSFELDTMVAIPVGIDMQSFTVSQKPPAQFTDRDVSLLANTPGVIEVYPEITEYGTVVTFRGENRSLGVSAIVPKYYIGRYASQVDKGRYLSQSDQYAVVLGSNAANGTFGKEIHVGSYITITDQYNGRSHDYVVVGIMKQRNASILMGSPNSAIYMTKAGLKALSDADTYSDIGVRAASPETADATANNVRDTLAKLHRNEGYSVMTQKMFVDMIAMTFSVITYTLAGISAISLVVGGIGIMNIMTLTVKERIKEIGLMKAVGATNWDVRLVFITESALLGFFSGLVGVILSAIVAALIGGYIDLPIGVSPTDAIMGVGFGLAITVVFGVYPANQAARLDPIEALRTE